MPFNLGGGDTEDPKRQPLNPQENQNYKFRQDPSSSSYANMKDGYDPQACPPNIDMAIKHSMASRVAIVTQAPTEETLCEDCGLPTENETIPLCGAKKDLAEVGIGFSLYFGYLKYCAVLLLLMFAFTGIFSMIYNPHGTICETTSNSDFVCGSTWQYTMSLAHKSPKDSFLVQSILNLLFVVNGVLFLSWIKSKQNKEAVEADIETSTPSDFTIMVTGLPKEEESGAIFEYFNTPFGDVKPTVKKVHMAYDIEQYKELIAKRDKLHHQKRGKEPPADIDQQLLLTTMAIQTEMQKFSTHGKEKFTGIAFVTFNKEAEADAVAERFKLGWFEWFGLKLFGCCMQNEKTYKGTVVEVTKAVEPTDVCWENLACSDGTRAIRKLFTNVVSAILIVGSYFLIYVLSNQRNNLSKKDAEKSTATNLLAIGISVLITVINTLLSKIVRSLVLLEKEGTWTKYYRQLSKKLSFCLVLNSVIIILWIELKKTDYQPHLWSEGSFTKQIYYLFATNAILPPFLQFLDIFYLIKKIKRWSLVRNPTESKLTQEEANQLMEGPQLDISLWYSPMQKTMMLSAFYAYLLPYGALISIGGIFLNYWVQKFLLLRRVARPRQLGRDLNDEMLDFLEYFFLVFAIGACVTDMIVKDAISFSFGMFGVISYCNTAALFVALILFLLPEKWTPQLFKMEELHDENVSTYDQEKFRFLSDYDRTNPITMEEANKEYKEMLKSQEHLVRFSFDRSKSQNNSWDPNNPFYKPEMTNGGFVQPSQFQDPSQPFQSQPSQFQPDGGFVQQGGFQPNNGFVQQGGFNPNGGFVQQGGFDPNNGFQNTGFMPQGGFQPNGGFQDNGFVNQGGFQPNQGFQDTGFVQQGGFQPNGGYQPPRQF